MAATNHLTSMSAAAAIAPIVLKSDHCEGLGTVYLAEKNTFLEFFNEESMSVKKQAFGRRSASKDSYLNARSANMVCTPDQPETEASYVTSHFPQNPSTSTMNLLEEIITPDSTPRWCNMYQYPALGCSDQKGNAPNAELQSPDSTPRQCNSITYQPPSSEWSDNKVSIPQLKLPISNRNEISTPYEALQSRDSTPRYNLQYEYEKDEYSNQKVTVAPDDVELLGDASTPRWCNRYIVQYDDASCKNQKAEAQHESWADQSEVLTPDTTPRWSNAYGNQTVTRSNSICSDATSATPRCNAMAFMNVPTSLPPSQATDIEKLKPPIATEIEELKQRLAALESENQRLKADDKIQMKPQRCYNEVTATPTAQENTLTISLDMLLIGGLKQASGKPANSATSGEYKESTMQMQPPKVNAVNTCNKKQGKRHQKNAPVTAEGATTLMMRGIPCGLTTENLIEIIDNAGFKGRYNFFYLPSDAKKKANLGYCFINFIDAQSADQCTAAFKGVRLAPLRSAKSCSVAPASIQGLARLSEHFKYTTVSRGATGPLFFNC